MHVKTFVVVLVMFLSSIVLSEADESATTAPALLKIQLTRQRTLPVNFTYFNANQVLLELHNNHNWSYSAEMTIGTPPQTLRIEFDTGSADLWVAGPAVCKTNPVYCKSHRTFNNSASSTFKSSGTQLKLGYGSEVIDIDIAIDDFVVNGLKIKNQYFGEAYKIENMVNDEKYPDNKDGIFGLSFQEISMVHLKTGQPSPLMNLVQQGQLPQPVFAFYLTHPMSKYSGELALGGVDPARYTGDFVFADVISQTAWLIHVDELYFGDKQVGKSFTALVDSGTSLIIGPPKIINPIREDIFGSDEKTSSVPCTKASSLPDITFVISGKKFLLTPADYVVKEYSKITCVFGFMPNPSPKMQFLVLGNVFMRKFYTMFDVGNRRVGFASAKEEENEEDNSPDEDLKFNILAS